MNSKRKIITIIIAVITVAAITSVSLYFILDNKNKAEIEETTSEISTTLEVSTSESTSAVTEESTSESTTFRDAKLPARKDAPTAEQKNTQAATTTSTTVEQTTFESGLPVKRPDPQAPVYDYYIESNNIFHKINCTIVKEYMNNGLYNELGDFTTVSYNTEQMQEQGYIPCEKCINQ